MDEIKYLLEQGEVDSIRQQGERLLSELEQSLSIQQSSCKLMNFNVEDILALPLLKEGRLSKNIQVHNIVDSVKEIRSIQAWAAQQKNVEISSKSFGFFDRLHRLECSSVDQTGSGYMVDLDEQRFQQVLLNYQSNALKFMYREEGKILVLL